jgi:hypothetical protein
MDLIELKNFLLWNLGFNYLILLIWFGAFVFARDAIFRLHSRWFALDRAQFDLIHYAAMAIYKIGILLFIAGPLLVLLLMPTDAP